MAIKAIALIRTSTTVQEIESQKKQVLDMCYEDGLKDDEIIIVGNKGASAIKVDDNYLRNMTEVYELIEKHKTITCVYAWAIDRIGRTREHLSKFRETLLSKKIQLVIRTPYLKLLNDDGSENISVGIAFSVFIEMAVQEMKQKAERFRRAKDRDRKLGKLLGGRSYSFGYRVDENNFIVPDEEEVKIVREIFEEYSSGKWSLNTLTTEMYKRGAKRKGNKIPMTTIRTILYCWDKYCGEHPTLNYPPIITPELAHKVKEMLTYNRNIAKPRKHHYFGSGILKCRCGSRMKFKSPCYSCWNKDNFLDKLIGEKSKCTYEYNNIHVKYMDGVLWKVALECYGKSLEELDSHKKKEYQKEIKIINRKLTTLNNSLNQFNEKKKRLVTRFVLEDISEDFINNLRIKLDEQRKKVINEINSLNDRKSVLQANLDIGNNNKTKNELKFLTLMHIEIKRDEEQMNDIVKKFIKKVVVGKFDGDLGNLKPKHRGKDRKEFKKVIELDIDTIYGNKTLIYIPNYPTSNKVWYKEDDNDEYVPFYFSEVHRKDGKLDLVFNGEEIK